KEAFEFGQNNWGILQRQKPLLFGVEFMCNSADTDDYDPDEYDECGGFYEHYDIDGNEVKDECPKELYIKVESDYDDYYDGESEDGERIKGDFNVEDGCLLGYWGKDKNVIIPDGIEVIGYRSFEENKNVEEVTIPDSVKEIESYAFNGCTKLRKVNMPDSQIEIADDAFSGCKLMANEDGFLIVNDTLVNYYGNKECVEIPDNVKTIGGYSFKNNSSIKKVIIGNHVEIIDYNAFENCSSLESIELSNSVKEIGSSAFIRCSPLESVAIPESVKKIDGWAFHECSSLKKVSLPKKLKKYVKKAFEEEVEFIYY
ncbi:MAG: leucine-rich repeat domain-containing protein, partial [Solobacterium sp.]|nr:leucine-rich repeat domain-containing protein [Solobacterium sp.]